MFLFHRRFSSTADISPFGVPHYTLWGHFFSVSTLRKNDIYRRNVVRNEKMDIKKLNLLFKINLIIAIPEILLLSLGIIGYFDALINNLWNTFFLIIFMFVIELLPYYGWVFIIPLILAIINLSLSKGLIIEKKLIIIFIILINLAILIYILFWWVTGQKIEPFII